MEDLGELAPLVQILDLPVPQMVDNVLDALRIPVRPMAVQVIEVPKILIYVIPAFSLVLEPQTEQLVEVPTVLSVPRASLCRSPSRSSTLQFRRVEVFSQNRIQQRRLLVWNAFLSGLWSRSLTFLLLVVALDRGLPHLLVLQMRILLVFFCTFPHGKKVRSAGSRW